MDRAPLRQSAKNNRSLNRRKFLDQNPVEEFNYNSRRFNKRENSSQRKSHIMPESGFEMRYNTKNRNRNHTPKNEIHTEKEDYERFYRINSRNHGIQDNNQDLSRFSSKRLNRYLSRENKSMVGEDRVYESYCLREFQQEMKKNHTAGT